MKIGFSSICCPMWDLRTIVEETVVLGYDGFELRALQGQLHLPDHPELAQNHQAVVEACEATRAELVCLATSSTFGSKKPKEIDAHKAVVREHVELASKLGCPFVRVFTGDVPVGSNRYETLGRIAPALGELAHFASRSRVTLLVENCGDLASSKDLWFLLDSVSHPALKACWNPINGMSVNDSLSIAVPRLGIRIGMVHLADAAFEAGVLQSYQALGQGTMQVGRLLELLTGIGYDGYLMLEWPKLWDDSLADPEAYLPESATYLKEQLGIKRQPLTAYKGDKRAPKFGELPRRVPVPKCSADD